MMILWRALHRKRPEDSKTRNREISVKAIVD